LCFLAKPVFVAECTDYLEGCFTYENSDLKYCNVDGQSGVFTVPCHAEPHRAMQVATQRCGKHLSAALPW
jgi:hypothetical protein